MSRQMKQLVIAGIVLALLLGACATTTPVPTQSPEELLNEVATMVAATLTALPGAATATGQPLPIDTPLPPPTEAAAPTQASPSPTLAFPTFTPIATSTAIPEYSCDIINQRPYDDTKFHRNESFVIKWTLVNTGTKQWLPGTHLQYNDGPRMTKVTSVDLPALKPGQQYEVVLGAVAPAEKDRQVMVWVVLGPKDWNSYYWMCYPYVRIIVVK